MILQPGETLVVPSGWLGSEIDLGQSQHTSESNVSKPRIAPPHLGSGSVDLQL